MCTVIMCTGIVQVCIVMMCTGIVQVCTVIMCTRIVQVCTIIMCAGIVQVCIGIAHHYLVAAVCDGQLDCGNLVVVVTRPVVHIVGATVASLQGLCCYGYSVSAITHLAARMTQAKAT